VAESLASHQGQRIVPERDLLTMLTRREFDAASARRLAETGMPYALEHFSIRLGVARVCEISFAFFFGNSFEKRGDCSPKFLNSSGLHFA
jgi:hypothetical protein